MIRNVELEAQPSLADYAAEATLNHPVELLQEAAADHVRALKGRTVWMVNSAEDGGGVAEMLPPLVSLLRALGVDTRWAVIEVDEPAFFELTKRLHNLLHGEGDPELTGEDRALYERVSERQADALRSCLGKNDLLVVHDPQPLAAGALAAEAAGVPRLWNCHIGAEGTTRETRAGWRFLQPWAERYDRTVFTLEAYVPDFLKDNAALIPPAIDPLSPKNRPLTPRQLTEVLARASLLKAAHPTLGEPFERPVRRLQPDGSLAPATEPGDLGLLFRPTILQVSRWDRLKGFVPLLEGFARLKARGHAASDPARRRLELARLVLAGPDPEAVNDDPEGKAAFDALCTAWRSLDAEVQRESAVLVLPTHDRHVNAQLVNALQRCATVVAQNSLREGFGLTLTEAMWKRRVVVGTHAAGLRAQLRDGEDGRLIEHPEDPDEVAATLTDVLAQPERWEVWSRNAQRRVMTESLLFTQVRRWLEVLSTL